jgi:hypothetical protein
MPAKIKPWTLKTISSGDRQAATEAAGGMASPLGNGSVRRFGRSIKQSAPLSACLKRLHRP